VGNVGRSTAIDHLLINLLNTILGLISPAFDVRDGLLVRVERRCGR
jgi:hypothetical protein